MKKDTLKWILVAAVVVAAAAYLYFSERKPNEKQGQRKARTEQVAIAEGHSKAFKIEPMEGITISAPENALDKDREFKLTAVDDKTYDRWTKAMKAEGMKPLMIFDLDAGLKPDEYFPGDYDVVMDLNKMGIPSDLQERVCVYRIAGKGKTRSASGILLAFRMASCITGVTKTHLWCCVLDLLVPHITVGNCF